MQQLPKVIDDLLAEYTDRRRRLLAVRMAAEVAFVFVIGAAVAALADIALRPGDTLLLLITMALYATVAATFVLRGVIPLSRRPSPSATAMEIERSAGETLEERLSTAVELTMNPDPNVSKWMTERTIAVAANQAAELDAATLLDTDAPKRAWRVSGVLLGVMCVAMLFGAPRALLLRVLVPGLNIARPSSTRLVVSPGNTQRAQGGSLTIAAEAEPRAEEAELELAWSDGLVENVQMRPSEGGTTGSGRFVFAFPSIAQGFTYRVRAGDAESERFDVVVDEPPRLKQVHLRIAPPRYSEMPERYVDGGEAEMLTGSEVVITAELAGAQAASVSMISDAGTVREMTLGPSRATITFTPHETFRYRLRMVGLDGLQAEPPHEWRLKVVPDEAPEVKLVGKGLDSGIVGSDELVVLDASAEDDVGLARVDLLVTCADERTDVRGLAIPEGSPALFDLTVPLDLGAYSLALGDTVRLSLQATDVGGRVARSDTVELVAATGEQARWVAIALRLRAELKALGAQEEAIRHETRVWGSLIRSFRSEDMAAQRGTFVLSQRRLDAMAQRVGGVASAVRSEAANMDASLGMLAAAVGDSIGEWSEAQGGMLHQAIATTLSTKPEGAAASLRAAKDLIEVSAEELGPVKRHLALLVSRVEAEALVGKAEASYSRQARTVPVVRGYHGWAEQGTQRGLLARFYRGLSLGGGAVCQKVGIPEMKDFSVPGIGPAVWSVRYSGEIQIPSKGMYKFVCTGDDGIRLKVGGNELLDKNAWKDQAATSYGGKVHLTEGWHPIEVMMYQNRGESFLSLQMGKEGKGLQPVKAHQFRCSTEGGSDWKALASEMASLPKGVLKAADGRLRNDFGVLAGVPGAIARMADDVGSSRLKSLAREQNGAAETVRSAVSSTEQVGWTVQALDAASSRVLPLVWAARKAREILQNELAQLRGSLGTEPGIAGQLKRSAKRAIARASKLDEQNGKLSQEERDARRQRHYTALKAELEQMERTLLESESGLLEDAKRTGATVGERRALLGERRALEDRVEAALAKADGALPASSADAAKNKGAVTSALNEVLQSLGEVARDASRAAAGRQASVATPALRSSEELAQRRTQGDAIGEMGAYRELSGQIDDLAELARDDNRFDTALALEEELGDSPAELRRETLERLMEEMVEKDRRNASRSPLTVAERLGGEVERLKRGEEGGVDTSLKRLSESPLALAVAGEQFRMKGEFDEAIAREVLARDLGEALKDSAGLTAERLRPLAERAKAIEGGLTKEAHDEELRQAAERYAAGDRDMEARSLEDLAGQADDAAKDAALRDEVAGELRQAAEPALDESTDAAFADARAESLAALAKEAKRRAAELEQLRAEAMQARLDAARARREFAELEESIAESLTGLKHAASREADRAKHEGLENALKSATASLPQEAGKIADLGKQAMEGAADDDGAAPKDANAAAQQADGVAVDPDDVAARAERAVAEAARAADLARRALEAAAGAEGELNERAQAAAAGQEQSRVGQRRRAEDLLGQAAELAERDAGEGEELSSVQDNVLEAMDASERAAAEGSRQGELDKLAAAAERAAKEIEELAGARRNKGAGEHEAGADVAQAAARMQELARGAHARAERERSRLDKLAEAMADSEGAHAQESLSLVSDERAAADELGRLAEAAERMAEMADQLAAPGAAKPQQNGLAAADAVSDAAERLAREIDLAARAAEEAKLSQLEDGADAAQKAAADAAHLARMSAADRGVTEPVPANAHLAESAEQFAKAARSRLEQARDAAADRERGLDLVERAEDLADRAANEAQQAHDAAEQAAQLAGQADRAQSANGPRELAASKEQDRERALAEGARKSAQAESLAESAHGMAERAMDLAQMASGGEPQDVEPDLALGALAGESESTQHAADEAQRAADQAQKQAAQAQQHSAQAHDAAPHSAQAAIAERAAERALGRANMAQEMAEAAQESANAAHRGLMDAAAAAPQSEVPSVAQRAAEAAQQAESNAARASRNAREANAIGAHMESDDGQAAAQGNALKADALAAQAEDLAARAAQLGRFRSDESAREFDETNARLGSMARERAAALQQDIAQPLAEAYRASGSATPDSHVGKLGRELGELVAEQQRAADLLERSLAKQDALRQELAEALSAGEETAARLGKSASGLVGPTPREADRNARAAQESANRLQQSADFAQERADRAQHAANESLAQAEQARYAAEQLAGNAEQQAKLGSAAQSAENAAHAAQQHASAAQGEALSLQEQASAAMPAPWSPQSTALSEQAISNLRRAQSNAGQAKQNAAGASGSPAQSGQQSGKQAEAQAQGARMAMIAASDGQGAAATELAKRLSEMSGQAKHAGEVQSAAAQLAGAESQTPPASSQAAAKALSAIQSSGGKAPGFQSASQMLSEAASQARLSSAAGSSPSSSQSSQKSGSAPGLGQKDASGDTGVSLIAGGRAAEHAAWARLPERVRSAIRSGGIERFSEEHQEAIRAYFRRLGAER